MVSVETVSSSLDIEGNTKHNDLWHINLSKSHIILLSLIFTILQNLSLSTLSNVRPIVLFVSLTFVSLVFLYVFRKIPLSTELIIKKIGLVVYVLRCSANDLEVDVWVIIICILLFGWIISTWKSFLSVTLWAIIIWIYNLTENNISISGNTSPFLESASLLNLTQNNEYFTESSESGLKTSAFRYINILERRVEDLTRKIDELEECKIQQNILIYTFNHKLTEKLENLEKSFKDKNNQLYRNFSTIQSTVEALSHRKRTHLAIIKMYVKQLLLAVLPNPVIVIWRVQKKILFALAERFQSKENQFES